MAILSGRWIGHYVDPHNFRRDQAQGSDRHTFEIAAEFVQNGERLEGTMTDLVLELGMTLKEHIDDHPDLYSERQLRTLQKMIERDPAASITATLPEASSLAGMVSERRVTFVKTYIGPHRTQLRFEGKVFPGPKSSGHTIEYKGALIDDDTLEGEWLVWRKSWFGLSKRITSQGPFRLTRA